MHRRLTRSHCPLGMGTHRRRHRTRLGLGTHRRRHRSVMGLGTHRRRRHRASGFLSDFWGGFKKGFGSVVGPFAKAALGGRAHRRRRLTPHVRAIALRNLAKARAVKASRHGGRVHRGRGRFTDFLKHVGKEYVLPAALKFGKDYVLPKVRSYARSKIPFLASLGVGVRHRKRRVHRRGAGWLDDVLGGIRSVSEAVAPIAVGALKKRYGLGVARKTVSSRSGLPIGYYTGGRTRKRRHASGLYLPRGYGMRRRHRARGLTLP